MEIKIIKSSMDILRKQYKHIHLSEEQVKNLVQDSWDAAEAQQAIIYDENNTAAVFCLCLDNIKRNAVFIHLSKHPMNGDWNAWRVYFRAPGTIHPTSDSDPFNTQLFTRFPGLLEKLELMSDMRLLAWKPQVSTSLVGPSPESLYDIIKESVSASFDEYTTRIYEPSAFGYSRSTQVDLIVEKLLDTYETARNSGKVFSVDSYLGCLTEMTNANGETLYLIISLDEEDYCAKMCAYTDIESVFHGDAAKLQKEISLLCSQPPRFKSMLWRFARFTQYEYSDLYNGEGIAKNVRLLKEVWSYDHPNDAISEARCLGNYLEGTFLRVLFEYKLWILDGSKKRTDDPDKKCYAVFNTGLVDITYRPVYMIFRWESNKWIVDSFRTVGNGLLNGKDESECPAKADYICGEIMRTMYCTDDKIVCNWRTPKISDDHVFENFSRLPDAVQSYCLGDKYSEYKITSNNAIVDAMPNENRRRLFRAFNDAIKVAISRAAWNMRTGVPVYYYKDGSVNVLLPLAMKTALDYELGNADSVDANSACDTAALMILSKETTSDGATIQKYECKTLFSLSMAYRDARLINRPKVTGLHPNNRFQNLSRCR